MKENLIKNVPMFAGLSEAEQQALAARMHLASYRAGEQVFAKGEASDAFYLIQEGWVKLTYESSQLAVATLGTGSLLGEAEFFQGTKRGMAAYAQTSLSAWVFDQEAIQDVIRQHSEIGLKLGLVLGFGIVQYRKYLLERVGHLSFLHALDAASRQAIVDRLVPQSYPSNEVVFRSGDSASGLYLVESGTVRLINDDGSYEEVGPGEALGELAVLAGKPHPHSAQVVSPAVIWQLSPTDFTRLAETYPQLRTILGRNLRSTLSAADRVQAVEMLKRISLFVNLERRELDSVASRLLLRYVQAGDTVFVPGDAGDAMYLIESGHVEIISDEEDQPPPCKDRGLPQTLARLIPGDYFGEMALLTGRSRTVAARAIVHTNLWTLYRSDFDGLLVKHPALTVALSRALRERLSHAAGSFVPPHLHGLAVSGDLSRVQLEEMAGCLTAQTYRHGDAIFYAGRSGDTMYFIESGRVDLIASGPRGPVALSTFEAGDFFGETALLTGMPHGTTARMAADGTLWALKKSDFDNLLQKHPNLAVVFSRVSSERQAAAMDKVRGSRDAPAPRPRPSRPAPPPAPEAPPRRPGAASAPRRSPERPAEATSRPAPAPRPAPARPTERPADTANRPAPAPRPAPGRLPEWPAEATSRPAPAPRPAPARPPDRRPADAASRPAPAPRPAPSAPPPEQPARPYRPAPPSERPYRPASAAPERVIRPAAEPAVGPVQPERPPSPSAPPTSSIGEVGQEEQPLPPEQPAPPAPPARESATEPIPHAAARPQPEQPVPPASTARNMAATEAIPRVVARPQPERPAPSGKARPAADKGTSRTSKPLSGRLGGRIGALAVWFTTRSRHVKVGLLILLLLLVWLCGVTLPSTLINELSANLNGSEDDFSYAYARGGNGLGLARPLLLPGARENGAVAALPFIETVTPTPSLTPTPTDTPTITPTSTGTPLPTWTPTPTVTFTPPPPTSTPTPVPDTPTPKPRAKPKPRLPTDTPTPEPTPTPDVDYVVASVRQLSPCENEGNHHIYIHVVDQNDAGIDGVPLKVCWGTNDGDCVRPITETKSRGKGWVEFAMFKGTYNVQVDGAKSMVASGITPDFQRDEQCPATGNGVANSLYHASFEVTIKKVR